VRALALEARVRLPGHVPARRALAAADVACVPSLKEGLSVFSLEAQAAGLPVVASAVGGLTESVEDGVTGRLVPPGDEAALAAALGDLLADPALRRRLGDAARVRVRERFTAARMAEATVGLYRRVAAGAA
jgi:glycosyltransferase involved in cell wall biosynthesis